MKNFTSLNSEVGFSVHDPLTLLNALIIWNTFYLFKKKSFNLTYLINNPQSKKFIQIMIFHNETKKVNSDIKLNFVYTFF